MLNSIDWNRAYTNGVDYKRIEPSDIDRLLKDIPSARRTTLLDVGCGTGLLTREMYHRGFNVTGIDSSSEAILVAQRRSTRIQGCYINSSLESYLKSDNTFDIITMHLVLAFLPESAVQGIIDAVADSGYIWVVSPTDDDAITRGIGVDKTTLMRQFSAFVLKDSWERPNISYFLFQKTDSQQIL
ncbi:class I SAM-dependent methyltransferase [Mycobacteroides abscessus]|uniref:class I SAM-dependent methyltransferase n=1 Tax=Mycobacteroides abscessus TaxID=36809 RepID=UPI0021080E97|nr:class I SAM-dependent methyltransferase [Mycobacteroides abscessus]